MVTETLLILFLLSLILFLCYFYASFFIGAPFVITPMHIVNEMMMLGNVKKKDIVVDLGSGDGRILISAAKKGAHARGWEINPFLVAWTTMMALIKGVKPLVAVYCKSYHQADLRSATVVMFYNIPTHVPALEKKLKQELKPGTKILSYQFPLSKFTLKKETESGIYLYIAS